VLAHASLTLHQRRFANCYWIPASYTSGQTSYPRRHPTCWFSSIRSFTVPTTPCHAAWTSAPLLTRPQSGNARRITEEIRSGYTGLRSVRSRRILGGVGVGFLATLGVEVGIFCPTPDVQLDDFLQDTPETGIPGEMTQFFWNFCRNRASLLCTTISIDFNSLISFPACWRVGFGNFGKVEVGVGYFSSESTTLVLAQHHKTPDLRPRHRYSASSIIRPPINRTGSTGRCIQLFSLKSARFTVEEN